MIWFRFEPIRSSSRVSSRSTSAAAAVQVRVRVSSVPQNLHPHLAFRVLVEGAHPYLADAVTVHPICQEEICDP